MQRGARRRRHSQHRRTDRRSRAGANPARARRRPRAPGERARRRGRRRGLDRQRPPRQAGQGGHAQGRAPRPPPLLPRVRPRGRRAHRSARPDLTARSGALAQAGQQGPGGPVRPYLLRPPRGDTGHPADAGAARPRAHRGRRRRVRPRRRAGGPPGGVRLRPRLPGHAGRRQRAGSVRHRLRRSAATPPLDQVLRGLERAAPPSGRVARRRARGASDRPRVGAQSRRQPRCARKRHRFRRPPRAFRGRLELVLRHLSNTEDVSGQEIGLAVSVFLACAVEAVEALTIVLAVGVTRSWRSALTGVGAATLALAVIVAALGPALTALPIDVLRVVVGGLLLVFGLQWLRKAVLRYAGLKALHDEDKAFAEKTDAARSAARAGSGFDAYAFTIAFKGVLLEGLEVVFIVITFGASQHNVGLAAVAAAVAIAVVVLAGVLVRAPLARVPENTLKFFVGVMLTSFGIFWGTEGAGATWPGGDAALLVIIPGVALAALGMVRWLRRAHGVQRPLGETA